MKRKLAPMLAVVLLVGSMLPMLSAAAVVKDEKSERTSPHEWDGRGTDSKDCEAIDENREAVEGDGWIHWVFSTKGESTNAQLTLGGTGDGTFEPGEPLEAKAYHFYTPYFDLDGLTAEMTWEGNVGPGGGLVISDYCPGVDNGEDPQLGTTLNFQKVVCDSDVDLSEYQNAPDNPAGVDTPVTPLEEGDLPEGCSFDTANWDFELSVDGDESTYTASESVSFSHLFDELGAGAAKLFGAGNQLEVAEVEQEGYDFFALSCHQDALNSDNLEYIFHSEVERFDNIWCRAWNTTEVVVEPEPTVAQFSVTKEVEGDEPVDPFEFTWECTVGFDRPMDFSVMNGVYAYDGSFDLSDGETYESDELMLRRGMELDCEVAETETRGADSVSNSLNGEEVAEFTLEAGQTQEITFTNVFEPEVLADDDEIEEDPTPDAEPEVLGAEAQVVAPKGAVDAGASSSALLGLLSSIALVVAGFATRRFVG